MSLDDAKASLEALPGVYEVNMFIDRTRSSGLTDDGFGHAHYRCWIIGPNGRPEYVKFCVRVASPEILPEETRQGILRIHETLERELGCKVSFAVSAGLQRPNREE